MDKLNLSAPLETLFQVKGESMSMMKAPDFGDNIKANAVNLVSNNNLDMSANHMDAVLTVGDTFGDMRGGGMGVNAVDTVNHHYAGYYWDYWQPYNHYYHSCYHNFTTPDKFETAFKLARKLMDKKLVKPMKTIEDFFKLMDAVVESL